MTLQVPPACHLLRGKTALCREVDEMSFLIIKSKIYLLDSPKKMTQEIRPRNGCFFQTSPESNLCMVSLPRFAHNSRPNGGKYTIKSINGYYLSWNDSRKIIISSESFVPWDSQCVIKRIRKIGEDFPGYIERILHVEMCIPWDSNHH